MEIRNPAVVSERSDDEQFIASCTHCAVTAAPSNFLQAPSCRRLFACSRCAPTLFQLDPPEHGAPTSSGYNLLDIYPLLDRILKAALELRRLKEKEGGL